jgi:hypothetical protein
MLSVISEVTIIKKIYKDIHTFVVCVVEMTNPIVDRLNERGVNFSPYQWEGGYNGLYNSVKSYYDLRMFVLDGDVNTKIFTMKEIVPHVADLLPEEQKRELSDILQRQLTDNRMCDIGGSTSYADNEDTTTVSSSGRYALRELEHLQMSIK